jgi:hypothetical protein
MATSEKGDENEEEDNDKDDKEKKIIQALLRWGSENGIRTHPRVQVVTSSAREDEERGVFYVHHEQNDQNDKKNDDEDNNANEKEVVPLVSIPEKALLCVRRPITTGVKKTREREEEEEEEDDALCQLLLTEIKKDRTSFWSAYISTLPNDYDLLELWMDEEIEELQVESSKVLARELRRKLHSSYDRQCKTEKEKSYSWEEWSFAKATVRSRTVSVPWSSAGALAPVGDMFNYAPVGGFLNDDDDGDKKDGSLPVGTGVWNEEKNAFEFRGALPKIELSASRSFELFMNYGAYTNLELLSLYGFHCGQNNPNDVIVLNVPEIKKKTTEEYRAKVISTSGALTFESERDLRLEYAVIASYTRGTDKRAQRTHMASQRHSFSALASRGEKLNNESERNFCTAVRDAAGRALLSFATTAKQDCDLLEELLLTNKEEEQATSADSTSSRRRRRRKLAIEYRLAVKRALQKTYRLYEKRISMASDSA